MGTCISPAVSRLWSYTAFEIPSHAEVELEIRYSVLVNWYTGLSTLAASPLSRFFPYGGQFYYDFTPAQHWGNGKVTRAAVEKRMAVIKDFMPEVYQWIEANIDQAVEKGWIAPR